MSLGVIDGTLTLTLDVFGTFALCAVIYLLSTVLGKKVKLIQKLGVPPIVVTGVAYSILYTIFTSLGIFTIAADQTLSDTLFLFFFTTVGFGTVIDKKMMKSGGKLLVILFFAEGLWLFVQEMIAMGVGGGLLGMPYPIAFLCGPATMMGGIPSGVAWGTKIEAAGLAGAVGIGVAAGAIGQIMGGFLGAPVAKKLFIEKHKLSANDDVVVSEETVIVKEEKREFNMLHLAKQILYFGIVVSVGLVLRNWFMEVTGFYVLDFIGSMILAIILVNVNEKVHFMDVDQKFMSMLGDASLNFFIAMSFLSLNLVDLKNLIGPTLIVMVLQAIAIILFCIFLFKILGKTYDLAVILAGFIGHGLGNVTTAFANMDTLSEEYGKSRVAYVIVPMLGACLIDVFDIPLESIAYNLAMSLQGLIP